MRISVIGTGYVGLVTGVCLSEIGHDVTCIDIDPDKIKKMKKGKSPIYEPGLEELMQANLQEGRLHFTANKQEGIADSDVIYIAVGTPQNSDGSADLSYIMQAVRDIAKCIQEDTIVVTKSTVPVGTNDFIQKLLNISVGNGIQVDVVSNPEFLREGSAVNDTFNGDRIVIGSESERAASVIEEVNAPFQIPVFKTNVASAEMIKYASNAFLATKISFINEVAHISEKTGADINDVAKGMGQDKRIGEYFLNAGIGYGGSCFPKDTNALLQIAEQENYDFKLLKSVIDHNEQQKITLVDKAKERFGSLLDKKIALLGLSFKPNTDDMREAPSIPIADHLVQEGATVVAYDPIATVNAKELLPKDVAFAASVEEAMAGADAAFIITEWEEITETAIEKAKTALKHPILFDGRNCYSLEHAYKENIEYHSIGRKSVVRKQELVVNG